MSQSVVRTNINSMVAHRNMTMVANTQTRASQSLSSGKRINEAADDVAGMGIAEKMRSQVRSLDRASMNTQDGISLIQTAEGALSSITDMLIRMKELMVKASNDTNVHDPDNDVLSDRRTIQTELDQLMFEINNIAYRTQFSSRTLLDGSLAMASRPPAITSAAASTAAPITNRNELPPENVAPEALAAALGVTGPAATQLLTEFVDVMNGANNWNDIRNLILHRADENGNLQGVNGDDFLPGGPLESLAERLAEVFTLPGNDAAADATWIANEVNYVMLPILLAGLDLQLFPPPPQSFAAGNGNGNGLWFHVGAGVGQGVRVGINSVTTESLGRPHGDLLDLIDVVNPSGFEISQLIDFIDQAITQTVIERSYLGSVQNRLEFSKLATDVASENLQAAESRIRDADMAREMMNLTQANILQQAAVSMIAQANQAPQAVLQLLNV